MRESEISDLIDDTGTHTARTIEAEHRPGDAARRPHTLALTVVLATGDMRIAHEVIPTRAAAKAWPGEHLRKEATDG
ncbi:hypothetical protein ACIP39_05475 [Streptomyces tibetensis]|uniref:hypothetical protein n=1 Tax=Streptomyces tibetensis TaxID=2382123 RepID=UPI00381FC30F